MKMFLTAFLFVMGIGSFAHAFDEQGYLNCNPDVAAAVYRGDFRSGYDHYLQYGQYENRSWNCHAGGGVQIPRDFDEAGYLRCHPDVAAAVRRGDFNSGYEHYLRHGRAEGRRTTCGGRPGGGHGPAIPRDFDEAGYLRCHPDVAAAVRRGDFASGYEHYLRHGRGEGRRTTCAGAPGGGIGGERPPRWFNEREYLRCNADVRRAVRKGDFTSGWHHYQLYGQYENRALTCAR